MLHDLPIATLRRQLDAAYLALEALGKDRARIMMERDQLRSERDKLQASVKELQNEAVLLRDSRRQALRVLLRRSPASRLARWGLRVWRSRGRNST
jgi:chromosome segregation ATPase